MKKLIMFAIAFISLGASAKDISLTGLKAKAVYDTLSSIEKLADFQDGGMGKRYLNIGSIVCTKSTEPHKEVMACTFKSPKDMPSKEVSLYSDNNNIELEEIRFVLAEATKAEKQVTANKKQLNIKSLACKESGLGHVLDDNSIELSYVCGISL